MFFLAALLGRMQLAWPPAQLFVLSYAPPPSSLPVIENRSRLATWCFLLFCSARTSPLPWPCFPHTPVALARLAGRVSTGSSAPLPPTPPLFPPCRSQGHRPLPCSAARAHALTCRPPPKSSSPVPDQWPTSLTFHLRSGGIHLATQSNQSLMSRFKSTSSL